MERVRQIVPENLDKFKVWGDRECGTWPVELQILGSLVADGVRPIDEFKMAYDAWLHR